MSYVIGMVGHVQSGTPCHSNPSFACFFSAHLSQFFNVATVSLDSGDWVQHLPSHGQGVFDRLNEYATEERNQGLAYMHSIFLPCKGLENALVFGTNRMVLNAWRNCGRRQGGQALDETGDRELLGDNPNDWAAISLENIEEDRMGDMQDVRW
ncbi:hypothetical protein BASA81_014041 [Batrachochytrium salamandrivorans]|nr:hypothetical protein BASA81_014041 [Batrachochytrium salamandrivorans]